MEYQTGTYTVNRICYWQSAFSYDAAAFIFHRIEQLTAQKDFRLTCTPGTDRVLVVYCKKGSGTVHHLNHDFTLSAGQFLILHIISGYTVEASTDNWQVIWFQISGSMANHISDDLHKDKGFLFSATTEVPAYLENIFSLAAAQSPTPSQDLKLSLAIYALLGELYIGSDITHKTAAAVSYINNNYMFALPVDILAEQCHMSKYHFIRCFTDENGMTPNAYIIQRRIMSAQKLLLSTRASISEISRMVGFDDVSYFGRLFKRMVGSTPGNYRKNLC